MPAMLVQALDGWEHRDSKNGIKKQEENSNDVDLVR